MINSNLLDFSNQNLLDSNIVGRSRGGSVNANNGVRRRKRSRSNERYSGVDYAELGQQSAQLTMQIAQQRQQNPNVQKKKELKSVCGRRPLLKKKRGDWDKCVAEYMKSKQPTTPPAESSQSYKQSEPTYTPPSKSSSEKRSDDGNDKKILGMSKSVAIPVIVGVVAIAGFFVYKKFFANSSSATIATPVV